MAGIGDLVATLSIDTSQFVGPLKEATSVATESGDQTVATINQQKESWSSLSQSSIQEISRIASAAAGLAVKQKMSVDTSDFTGPLKEATSAAEESGERVIHVVNEQKGSWLQLATNAVPAIEKVTASLAGLGAAAIAARSQTQLISTFSGAWSSAGSAILQYGGIAARVAGTLIPQWRIATTVIGGSLLAYKVATSDMAADAGKAGLAQLNLSGAFSKLGQSLSNLASTAKQPFVDMGQGVVGFLQEFNPIPSMLNYLGKQVEVWANKSAESVNYASQQVTYYGDYAVAAALAITSASNTTIATYASEGREIRANAAETQRVTTLLEARRPLYQSLADAQKTAVEAAAHAEKLYAIGHLTNIDLIEEEIRKQQQLSDEQIRSGKFSEKQNADIVNALQRQKAGVESGRIKEPEVKKEKSPIEDILRQAQQQVAVLKLGETEAAVAAAAAKGATQAEQAALRAVLQEKMEIVALNDAQKKADTEAEQSRKQQQQLAEQSSNQVAKLRDRYDEMTGAATKGQIAQREAMRAGMDSSYASVIGKITDKIEAASNSNKAAEQIRKLKDELDEMASSATKGEIAMRNALREGATKEQAEEIKKLTDAKDKIKKKDSKDGENKASLAGTSDTAKIILSGLTGGGKDKLEDIGEKQIVLLKALVTKKSPPPPSSPIARDV